MDWIIFILLSVLKAALCFNIDPVAWKTLKNSYEGFGYQVVQRPSDLLVSAPLAQSSSTERGKIFKCSAETESCSPLPIPGFAINMSLGLTMTNDPTTDNTLACGPTIPTDCKSITMYSGICMQIDRSNGIKGPVPSTAQECRLADIAFLLDGSGSVSDPDFQLMKRFVRNVVDSLMPLDTRFSISQFSKDPKVHYYFNDFLSGTQSWQSKVDNIGQLRSSTYTAKAIEFVVNNVFNTTKGSRPNAKKVLIVITDGQSHDREHLQSSADLAETNKIVRFAIGVGSAFASSAAKQELDTISSSPTENVFRVQNFDALEKIRATLQAKLFAIEGSQTGGESLKMEMAQEGFSAVYVPGGVQIGMVGANVWKGGYLQYSMDTLQKTGSFEANIEEDSYVGYSMAVARTTRGTLTIMGAPRYKHRGVVRVVYNHRKYKTIDPSRGQFQVGEYFGAVVCAMDVNRDGYSDLILISAPMYIDSDREGRVYVCTVSRLDVECHLDSPSVLRGDASQRGRFGSSLAVLPDLDSDGLRDLAVGAPLENDGQGSIYIFHGEGGIRKRISSTYTQRIPGSEVKQGLKFFGMSISQSSFDQSSDNLPDLAVGSKGSVVLLRSKPIIMVEARVSFDPSQISTQNSDCTKPLEIQAKICFSMTSHSRVQQAKAKINYVLTLDATRKVPNNRAYVVGKKREVSRNISLDLTRQTCNTEQFLVEACPEDSLNALDNELKFTFEGLPSAQRLRPSLALQAQTTTFHRLGFEINCGTDNVCVDTMKLDFNFTK
ncbi:integrin alpha-X [Notothenia coriiceps]|uniref:Integrin alpha-X n=1 Tax=Notothenia coriiceps TaxID=8208 RepID=A0A6I9P4X2_9TELE|nr:PREDICTED: integrin alpha-X-like [Notothenia coriiceps]